MKKISLTKTKLPALVILLGMLFGAVPSIQAQTVQEWNEPINLSMSGGASNPTMVVDGTGVLHAIWTDEFDGYKYSQSLDGKTWSAPITAKYPFSQESPPPVLFSDAAGLIHIFYLDDQNKLTYAQSLPDNLDTPTAWRAKAVFDAPVFDFDITQLQNGFCPCHHSLSSRCGTSAKTLATKLCCATSVCRFSMGPRSA